MATLSTTVIANMALSLLGVAPILGLTDNTKPGKSMNLWYGPTRDEVIRGATWTFARARATLARLTENPSFGWTYQYQLPVNPKCLLVLRLIEGTEYVVEGDRLLTNWDTAKILYLKRVTDTTKFDSLFVKAFAFKLAHDACFDITGSLKRAGGLAQQYEHIRNIASGISSAEHHRTPDTNNAWVQAGHSGLLVDEVNEARLTG